MPDFFATKSSIRKLLGIANKQAKGSIEVETNVTTVSDANARSELLLRNVDNATDQEALRLIAKGNDAYYIESMKLNSGSDRTLVIRSGSSTVSLAANGFMDFNGSPSYYGTVRFYNPALTFSYQLARSAIAADRTITLPLLTGNDTVVCEAHTATLTNKTLTSPVISTISNTGTLTLPTSTDTLVGRATTDTLTNKTLTIPQINGLDLADAAKTANYTLTTSDVVIRADSSSTAGGITMTLPAASGNTGLVYAIKKIDTSINPVIVDANASETLDGATTVTLTRENDLIIIECDGSNWEILKSSIPDNTAIVSNRIKLSGLAIPAVAVNVTSPNTLMGLHGVFHGMTATAGGTSTHTLDATEGLVSNFVSAATTNVNTGLTSAATTNAITTAAFNPVLSVRFKIDSTTASRVWIGFTESALAISDTPQASGDACALFGFSTADTVFSCRSNDTTGAVTTTAMTGITKDANWHTITIAINTSQVQFVLDDGAGEKTKTITTAADRPGNTDPLLVHFTGQTSTTTAKTFSCKFAEFRADK